MTTRIERLKTKIRRDLGSCVIEALEDPEVIEIALNPDGRLWVEKLGDGHMKHLATLNTFSSESAIKTIAGYADTVITKENPIISCELPIDGSRFQAMIHPVVEGPTLCIRKRAVKVFNLSDYTDNKIIKNEHEKIIIDGIKKHKNFIISGGTGSGKTTLSNALINEMVSSNPKERILIIEDTREIQCTADNCVIMKTSDTTNILDLLKSCMRLRPDRILVGEVRGGEAWTLFKAWNTGHPGGLVTVHADSATSALIRMEQLCSEDEYSPRHGEYLKQAIAEAVDLVVHIERDNGGRIVRNILKVTGFSNGEYLKEKL